jgi:hypothetical protein
MSPVQNNGRTTGGITGRGFMPGRSGNPGGRPKGLAKATRALVGEDGMALVELWWSIASDPTRCDSGRLEASRLLADRGWGRDGPGGGAPPERYVRCEYKLRLGWRAPIPCALGRAA